MSVVYIENEQHRWCNVIVLYSIAVDHDLGLSSGHGKPKTVKLVFAASPVSTHL
jgi:hypothetical protein